MNSIKIKTPKGERKIGEGFPVFTIAEAGANFRISSDMDENFRQAIRLIDIAADANADAVKFQLYRAEKMYVKGAGHADYIGKSRLIYDIIKDMELPYEWLPLLKKHCDKRKIMFLCTPFDEQSADELEKIGIEAYKMASYSISHMPLLKYIAKKGKPMIISTGASSFIDIQNAIDCIIQEKNSKIALMQCTAKYPAPLNSINLKVIVELKHKFNVPTGLSDHSRNPLIAPLGAVALGASIIEKHFTTDNSMPGPDHGFAILPEELNEMVNGIRMMEDALGTGKKEITKDEKELYEFARRYIYASKDIKKGEEISKDNIAVLRSGKEKKGIEPSKYWEIIGKNAAKDIKEGKPITPKAIK